MSAVSVRVTSSTSRGAKRTLMVALPPGSMEPPSGLTVYSPLPSGVPSGRRTVKR